MTNLIWLTIIILFLSIRLGVAFEYPTKGEVVSQNFAQSLSELKNSVEQLARSNEELTLKNTQFKVHLNNLQESFQKLMGENQQLNTAKLKLQEPSSSRTKQILQIEGASADLDQRMNSLNEQIKILQGQVGSYKKEDEELNKQMGQSLPKPGTDFLESTMPPELSELWEQKRKEKLAMLKIISEAQVHQKLLQEQLLDFQKNTPVGNPTSDQSSSRKMVLESQIQQLQQEVEQLSALTGDTSNLSKQGMDDEQLRQLQISIGELEKNRNELKGLVAKMQQKAQRIPLTKEQKHEQTKLQSNIVQLKRESKDLKFDLQDLQQQMIELDKRKTYLENLLKV